MANTGTFVRYDLVTPDQDAAKAFYTETIGWKTQEWGGGEPYIMWVAGGQPLGGIRAVGERERGGGRRRRCPGVGGPIGNAEVRLVADPADHGWPTAHDGPGDDLAVERLEILERAASAHQQHQVDVVALRESIEGRGDLVLGADALHACR